jgi:hypothetical protein
MRYGRRQPLYIEFLLDGQSIAGACSRWRRADRSTALPPVRHGFGRHGGWFEHGLVNNSYQLYRACERRNHQL